MAKSEAEKKAYAKEYYQKYRKKGVKKGRKKGKKGSQTGLLGVTTSGLNSDGAVEAAVIKDRIKKEMNEALSKATSEEEKVAIRKEYAKKANDEIAKLKADPKFAKAKATKASAKSSSKSSGSSKSSSGSKSSSSNSQAVSQIKDSIAQLESRLASLTDEQKVQVKESLQTQLDAIKKRLQQKKLGI